MKNLLTRVLVLVVLASLLLPAAVPASPPARAQVDAPTDIPTTLVTSGVNMYTLKPPKVFWYTGVPPCPPPLQSGGAEQPAAPYPEMIRRISALGGETRTLYDHLVDCGGNTVLSENIASDGSYIYWLNSVGMVKLSTDANPGDEPQLMNALVDQPGEVADGGDVVYAISNNTGGANTQIMYVRKDNNQRVLVTSPGTRVGNLQWDGKYVYYSAGGSLMRVEPGVGGPVLLASGVTGYYAEGRRLVGCTPSGCLYTDRVYVGQGREIRIFNNITGMLGNPIYTSTDSSAQVYSLVTDRTMLFFFESRETVCDVFCTYISVLQRTARSGGAADSLYTYPTPDITLHTDHLAIYDDFVYWQDDDQVLRLPKDASALPMINMWAVGMEVTQGVQDLTNTVLLIKDRRTFVRVYVKSDGDAVDGVTARLYSPALGLGPLLPANPAGTDLTVRHNPERDDISESFLFELPWSWIAGDSLDLLFVLNPYKVPLEPDYTDNSLSLTLPLNPSPSLSVEMFMLNYTIGGVYYSPRLVEDVYQAFSWIQRAYPLGGAPGEYFKPRAWTADFGELLGSLVNRSNPVCTLLYPPPDSDPSLCASYFMNAVLWTYRVQTLMGVLSVGLNPFAFYYGMITDASGNFARGQAAAPFTSVGPTGIPGSNSWDTDGSYGDWYAAHEIGHSLGRAHPIAGSDDPATPDVEENCRHSRSDLSYPYGNTYTSAAPIGPYDHTMEGFDVGDPIFGIQPAVYPSDTWNDVMSYCSNQWISDYTYENMYNHMIAFPTQMATSMRLLGDYLIAAGVINPDADTAAFSILLRSNDVTNVPDLVPGDYSLRLLDTSNNVLADYAFTPLLDEGTGTLGFGQVVALEPGTTTVQLVKLNGDQVLASQAISANPPAVSDVALVDAPNPVTGVVTLEWSASDPDGDSLTYEVIFSRDDGISFMPVAAGLTGSSAQIDTASLPGTAGDNGILRVVASDGVNTGYGDTAPFVMASKLPEPFIITPDDGLHIHYGQLVNFSGMALDVQDGTVADAGLSWQDEDFQEIGSGALLSLDKLPVGSNIIYLKATNSAGKSAYAQVTVYVDDDLNLLGPTLAAGPAPVGWHVGEGSTELQTAEVYINNAGSGDLDWTASEDAAWLSLDAASGTITAEGDPSTLTLTADPSGLAPNTSYSADLTITSNGLDPEQTVVIHVTLSVGDIRSVPIPEKNIYLPLVTRE